MFSHHGEPSAEEVSEGSIQVGDREASLGWLALPHGIQVAVLAQEHRVGTQGLVKLPHLRCQDCDQWGIRNRI